MRKGPVVNALIGDAGYQNILPLSTQLLSHLVDIKMGSLIFYYAFTTIWLIIDVLTETFLLGV